MIELKIVKMRNTQELNYCGCVLVWKGMWHPCPTVHDDIISRPFQYILGQSLSGSLCTILQNPMEKQPARYIVF